MDYENGLELILGLRVEKEGYAERTGVRIYYHAGDARYVTDFPAGIALCPPGGDTSTCLDRFGKAHGL